MAVSNKLRKRNLKKLPNKSITKFPACKSNSSIIILESPLEKDFCYHLEFDEAVKSYEPQPLGYDYFLDGQQHFYTPDFDVFFESSSCYYEIKYTSDIEYDETFQPEFNAKKVAAQDLGKDLVLVTDAFIAGQYRYENLCLLYKCANYTKDMHYAKLVHDQLNKNQELSISDLLREENRNEDFCSIHHLIWHKYLIVELDSELLSISSLVTWGNH